MNVLKNINQETINNEIGTVCAKLLRLSLFINIKNYNYSRPTSTTI